MGPPFPVKTRSDLRVKISSRRCFFREMPSLPGQKAAFSEKKGTKVKGGKDFEFLIRERFWDNILYHPLVWEVKK